MNNKQTPEQWFEELIRRMQTHESKSAIDKVFLATSEDLASTFVPVKDQPYISFDPEVELDKYLEGMKEILELATAIFNDEDEAIKWLNTPAKIFNQKPPKQICFSEEGREKVKMTLKSDFDSNKS